MGQKGEEVGEKCMRERWRRGSGEERGGRWLVQEELFILDA